MRNRLLFFCLTALAYSASAHAQRADVLGPEVRKYLRVGTPKVVLEHVQVIDGTGAAPSPDRNVTLEGGKITAISPGADVPPSDGTIVLDLRGYSVMPGIVGMHNHLFFFVRGNLAADGSSDGFFLAEMIFSGPRLYLANGVTTMRTTGTLSPYAELKLKQDIEGGLIPGPHMDVTGPYLSDAQFPGVRAHRTRGRASDRRLLGGSRRDLVQGRVPADERNRASGQQSEVRLTGARISRM